MNEKGDFRPNNISAEEKEEFDDRREGRKFEKLSEPLSSWNMVKDMENWDYRHYLRDMADKSGSGQEYWRSREKTESDAYSLKELQRVSEELGLTPENVRLFHKFVQVSDGPEGGKISLEEVNRLKEIIILTNLGSSEMAANDLKWLENQVDKRFLQKGGDYVRIKSSEQLPKAA